jgi:hypothetical protein
VLKSAMEQVVQNDAAPRQARAAGGASALSRPNLLRALTLGLGLAGSGVLSDVAEAALAPVGSEFQVNGVTSGFQGFSSVCRASDGSFVVVFANGLEITARRYDTSGQAVGGEFAVSADTTFVKAAPVATCSGDEGFAVAWESLGQDGSDLGVFARRFDGAGTALGDEFQVNTYTSGDQHEASICSGGDGGFILVWEDNAQDGSLEGVFGQRFDGAGLPSGGEFQVSMATMAAQSAPAVCCDAAGGFVVAWESDGADDSGFGIVGRRYDSAGSPVGDEFLVNTHTESSQANPAVCCDGAGGFVVAWESLDQDGLGSLGVFGQRYDGSGEPVGGEFQANVQTVGDQLAPALGCLPDGSFLISWEGATETPGDAPEIFARRYGSDGSAEGGELQVNSYTTGVQMGSSVAADGSGSFVVAWDSDGQDGSGYGVFARLFGPACDADAECDDANECTADTCAPGFPGADAFGCLNASDVICAAQDQCHEAGTCDPATGACSNPAKADGTACDDASACTEVDTCEAGTCVGASPVVCTAQDQCHEAGTCDPATGACSNPAKADGTACDDASACTEVDTCESGTCVGASPVVCTAQDQCHEVGTCDPATGACSNPAKADGTACDDRNACTRRDTCRAGKCTGGDPVVCPALAQCFEPGTCNPATGVCSAPLKLDGTPCGRACLRGGACRRGQCVGATEPAICTAIDDCHEAGSCDSSTGLCTNPLKPSGTRCDDGNACTQTDRCQSGTCVGTDPVECVAADVCHVAGSCNPQSGECSNPPGPDGAPCDDENSCTVLDACAAGACRGRLTAFGEAQCEMGLLQPATVCAPEELPKGLSRFIDKKLKRAVKALARAQQASEAGKTGKMEKQLGRFGKFIAAIRQKAGDFVEEGLAAACAAKVAGLAADLAAFVEAIRT